VCGHDFPDSLGATLDALEAQEWFDKPRPTSAALAKIIGCLFLFAGLISVCGAAAGCRQFAHLLQGEHIPKQDLLLLTLFVVAPLSFLESRLLFSRRPSARFLGIGLSAFLLLCLVGLWFYVKHDGGNPNAVFYLLTTVVVAMGLVLGSPPMRDFFNRDSMLHQRLHEIQKRKRSP
jgi:hypothetical protein